MPADVSQFIQMQRLRYIESLQPSRADTTLVHLHQHQFATPRTNIFLPDSKKKSIHSNTIRQYHYVPGIQKKRKIPITSSWGGQYNNSNVLGRRIDGGSPNQTGPGNIKGGIPNQTGPGKLDGGTPQ
jgi:hypothetical protein